MVIRVVRLVIRMVKVVINMVRMVISIVRRVIRMDQNGIMMSRMVIRVVCIIPPLIYNPPGLQFSKLILTLAYNIPGNLINGQAQLSPSC